DRSRTGSHAVPVKLPSHRDTKSKTDRRLGLGHWGSHMPTGRCRRELAKRRSGKSRAPASLHESENPRDQQPRISSDTASETVNREFSRQERDAQPRGG